MSYEELDRVSVMERLIEKRLTQREAARMLGLTSRQVRRLRRAYARDGAVGLASKHRGRPSNRRLPSELRREALATLRSWYEGFGPTLAHEKLTELHGLALSVETLRHWMIEDGLWIPRARREPRIQQPRHRRPCRGELIQIDGSDHEWFEERTSRCTLLVFVDDATSALMELLVLRVGVGVLLLHGAAVVPGAPRQAGRAVQRQGRGISREPEGAPGRRWSHPVWPCPQQPQHRHPLRQHTCSEGPRRAGSPDATRSAREGAEVARDQRCRCRERFCPRVHCGLQPSFRAGSSKRA